MEHFYTLQGEGSHSGRAAYFIRLAGCDVGCVWCDVKESWDISPNQYLTIENIVSAVGQTPTDFVVITGGEPTMHNLTDLTSALHAKGYEIAIETAGVHPLKGQIDWYCFSPTLQISNGQNNMPPRFQLLVSSTSKPNGKSKSAFCPSLSTTSNATKTGKSRYRRINTCRFHEV
jgi:organic radical activating enzyme